MIRARLFFQLNLDSFPMNIMHKLSILFLSLYAPVSAKPQKNITFLVAEREYKTIETLPRFAEEHLAKKFSFQFCKATNEGEKRNILSTPSEIRKADLLFVSVRRRAFREETMKLIHAHFTSGKPIIGIRTSSHAFQLRKEKLLDGHQEWPEWDREVIGGNYNGHHGNGLVCKIKNAFPSDSHPILHNVKLPFTTPASLYRNSPLPLTSIPLLLGSVKGFPSEPVAWINQTAFNGKVFYTSLGHIEDFNNPAFNQLLYSAIKWCLEKD